MENTLWVKIIFKDPLPDGSGQAEALLKFFTTLMNIRWVMTLHQSYAQTIYLNFDEKAQGVSLGPWHTYAQIIHLIFDVKTQGVSPLTNICQNYLF